ncbi:hypothetical protein [Streptomyces sp. enrichment culture]|uniref:hypothetical protein n=1 Tax=Streptomyces sp. enrichment culture TaxID=1795815 RepID=UPI003F5724B4
MAARGTGVGARPVRDAEGARDDRAGQQLGAVEPHRAGPARERQDVGGRAGRQCVAGRLAGHGVPGRARPGTPCPAAVSAAA